MKINPRPYWTDHPRLRIIFRRPRFCVHHRWAISSVSSGTYALYAHTRAKRSAFLAEWETKLEAKRALEAEKKQERVAKVG